MCTLARARNYQSRLQIFGTTRSLTCVSLGLGKILLLLKRYAHKQMLYFLAWQRLLLSQSSADVCVRVQWLGQGAGILVPALVALAVGVGAFAASRYNEGATSFVTCAPTLFMRSSSVLL